MKKKQKPIDLEDSFNGFFAANELGKILGQKRRDLGIEIPEASSYLKVKPRDIELLESGNFSDIARHLYFRGLVKSYAKFLKIDQQKILEIIKLLPTKSNVENTNHQLINVGEENKLSPNKNLFFNSLLTSILLFLILLSLYNFYESSGKDITSQELIQELIQAKDS